MRVRAAGQQKGGLECGALGRLGQLGTKVCGRHPLGVAVAPTLTQALTPLSLLQVSKLRERLQEAKLEREQEQRRHTAYISALRAKLHEEKTKELQALREMLIRQHEQEAARTAKIKEGELQRLQATLNVLRDGAADKVKTALLAEAREEARKSFDSERLRLQQEILELKAARKQAEEALSNCMQADKTKAADLRAAYQEHQDEVHRIKRECERDIRRLVRAPCPCLVAIVHSALHTRVPFLPAHMQRLGVVRSLCSPVIAVLGQGFRQTPCCLGCAKEACGAGGSLPPGV